MRGIRRILRDYSGVILLALFFALAALLAPNFLTRRNVLNLAKQNCMLGFVTMGMSFVLMSGHMDLSVSGIVSFSGLIALSFQNFLPAGWAIAAALLVGLFLGALNGAIVVLTHANSGESLMITFGTQLIFFAASLLYTGGFSLPGSPSDFYNNIGIGMIGSFLPIPFLILLVFALAFSILESRTGFGRKLHMIGYNRVCCRLSGVKTGVVDMVSYGVSGLMAAAAAITLTSRTLGTTPTAGTGYEMDAIVAAVLGGDSLAGGKGSVMKAVVGVFMLGILSNAMNLMGFGSFDQTIVKGVVLVLAIAMDRLSQRRAALGV
jgi:ribose transport system permease protein